MIKLIQTYLFLICFISLNSTNSFAQFINIQLTIEAELSTEMEQALSFGTQVTGSGLKVIALGDPGMGIFSIKALRTQEIKISLIYPDNLESDKTDSKIPLDLNISYNNSGKDNPQNSIPILGNSGYTSIYNNNLPFDSNEVWQELFVYVYGSIDIGEIPNAEYEADVILNIDYN
jgi:hypothetical protein